MNRDQLEKKIIQKLNNSNYQSILDFDKSLDHFFKIPLENSPFKSQGSYNSEELYDDLCSEALLTSYIDYFQILLDAKGMKGLDIGAGNGRGTFLSSYLGNIAKLDSIELHKERAEKSINSFKDFEEKKNKYIYGNALDIDFSPYDFFYLYFPTGKTFDQILRKVIKLEKVVYFYICESHGDMIDICSKLSFLKKINEIPCHLPRHNPNIYKFKTILEDKIESPIKNFYEQKDSIYSFKGTHPLYESEMIWYLPKSFLEIQIYNGNLSFYSSYHRRYIDFDEFEIDEQDPLVFKNLNWGDYWKVLKLNNQLVQEDKNGQILPL